MIDYLVQYNIWYKYQSGFTTKHLTDLYLSYLNKKISKGFDNGLFNGMILKDLQKAFDTINHNILLQKLKTTGFHDNTVNWFHSYMTDQAFLVSIGNKYLSILKISSGVPQGHFLVLCFFWYTSMIWSKLCHQIYYYMPGFELTFQSYIVKNSFKISLVLVSPECAPWLGLRDRNCIFQSKLRYLVKAT